MKTNVLIKETVKTMALSSSIDDITVCKIVDYLGIKRQSFYYHYKDIYDVVQGIFLDDFYYLFNELKDKTKTLDVLNSYIKNNYAFIKIISRSNTSPILQDFIIDSITFYLTSLNLKITDSKRRIITNGVASEFIYTFNHEDEYDVNKTNELMKYLKEMVK